MHRIDNAAAAVSLPTPDAVGTPGYFQRGNSGTGVQATVVSRDFMNATQEELVAPILAAGLTLDKTVNDQLLQALLLLAGPRGCCRLSVTSTTVLTLYPHKGNQLTISGVARQIPAAGVTLANTGLVAATLYYVYAHWDGSAIVLSASTTGHVTSAVDGNVGVEVKSDDDAYTLVGMIYTGAGTPGTFVAETGLIRYCINWFNRRACLMGTGNVAGSTAATSRAVIGSSVLTFLTWPDECVTIYGCGSVSNNTSGDGAEASVFVDGAFAGAASVHTSNSVSGNGAVSTGGVFNLTEGRHTAQPGLAAVTGGTATCAQALSGFVMG
jgi:hypothetical protein